MASPIERLRYHVSGAIERREGQAIIAIESRPDPFGYFARKAAREADIRAAAPYRIDGGADIVPDFEALESRLKAAGLAVNPERRIDGGFTVYDPAAGYHCGIVQGAVA